MPHDAELVAEARGWFVRADRDLASGDVDLLAQPPLTGDAAFHAQQAAEKAMKGFLTWHGHPFRKTHNLTELGEVCRRLDASLDSLLRQASELTEYAWKFRYPGEPEEPPHSEAAAALGLAREVHETILSRLPADLQP